MSRAIIQDIVLPIVERIIGHTNYYATHRTPLVRDPTLETFLEEEMRRYFGVIGANDCQHLKEQLEEAYKNDPYAFEQLIENLLRKFIKLSLKIRTARKPRKSRELRRIREGPPDRFSHLRKKSNLPQCYR